MDVALSLGAGVIAWFATHFLARPLLKVYEFREKAHELIFYTANVTSDDEKRYQDSVDELRRLAAQVEALAAVMPPFCGKILSWFHINLIPAARGLTGLSNSLGTKDGSKGFHREQI